MWFNKDDKLPAIENNNFRQIKFQVYRNEIRFNLLFFLIRAPF